MATKKKTRKNKVNRKVAEKRIVLAVEGTLRKVPLEELPEYVAGYLARNKPSIWTRIKKWIFRK